MEEINKLACLVAAGLSDKKELLNLIWSYIHNDIDYNCRLNIESNHFYFILCTEGYDIKELLVKVSFDNFECSEERIISDYLDNMIDITLQEIKQTTKDVKETEDNLNITYR